MLVSYYHMYSERVNTQINPSLVNNHILLLTQRILCTCVYYVPACTLITINMSVIHTLINEQHI